MLRKKRLSKVDQIRDNLVVGISPEGSELKAIACLFLFGFTRIRILDGIETGTVGIVLRVGTIGDDKNLNIFKQTRTRPERVSLVAVNLVECFSDGNTSAL